MESVDQGNLENGGTYQFLRYFSNLAEPYDREDPLRKRTKLDNQNWYPIDRNAAAPEYIDIEPSENLLSRKQEFSFLNTSNSSEMRNDCPNDMQSSGDFVNLQGSVRGLTASSLESPVFSTGMVSSCEERWFLPNIEPSEKPLSRKNEFSFLNTSNSSEMGNDCPNDLQRYFFASEDIVNLQGSVRGLATSSLDSAVRTDKISSYEEKSTSIGKVLTPKVYRYCILYPPDGNVPKPTMERPLGCKSVVISGIPKNLSNEILMEVFIDCGNIHDFMRKKKDSVFQVTYSCESSVDKVLELNGYTLVSCGKESLKGIIHVDYVVDWADRLDFISRMEAQQKKKQKNEQILRPKFKESNPFSKISYSKWNYSKEAIVKLHKEFGGGGFGNYKTKVFIGWMEEGACNKNNCHYFSRVLSEMHNSVYIKMNKKTKLKESVGQQQNSKRAKCPYNSYFVEILKAFNVATSEAVFNNFSSRIKNRIEVWKKYIEDVIESNSRNVNSAVGEEKTNVPDRKISAQNSMPEQLIAELKQLQAENDRLKIGLRVAQREASKRYNDQIPQRSDETKSENRLKKNIDIDYHVSGGIQIAEKEARFIAAIGAFLNFYRHGESIESIYKYLFKIEPSVTIRDIECLMRKLPTVFKDESVEGGDDSKTKWTVFTF